jgi:hypothetical protein
MENDLRKSLLQKMKFLIATILTALLSFIAGIYISLWWSFAFIALLVALLVHQRAGKAFLAGFLGLFILWFVLTLWVDSANGGVLSGKIALLLPLGGSKWALIIITALIAGLIAGFAAMSGSFLRSLPKNNI